MLTVGLITAGLVLLVIGGEALVRGATGLAKALGVSPLLIGLVVVGFGTSTPELTTSVTAALAGSPDVAVGNVIGSNIANILLILAATALLAPIAVEPRAFSRDGAMLAIASVVAAGAIYLAPMTRLVGTGLVFLLLVYVVASYVIDTRTRDAQAQLHEAEADSVIGPKRGLAIVYLLAGLVGVIGGARLLVDGATDLALALGVSEAVIGLTVVAVGTSLPELAASLSAARKGESDIAFGNVVGSNIFNALFIVGGAALAQPFTLAPGAFGIDLLVMLGAAALLIVFAVTGKRISRIEGGVLLALYVGYTAWLAAGAAA